MSRALVTRNVRTNYKGDLTHIGAIPCEGQCLRQRPSAKTFFFIRVHHLGIDGMLASAMVLMSPSLGRSANIDSIVFLAQGAEVA